MTGIEHGPDPARRRARRSRRTWSSPGSGSSRTSSSPPAPACRSRTGSSSTRSAGSAAATTCSRPATSPASRSGARRASSASSTRTTRRATAGRSARTWPAPAQPYDHLPFFYSDLFDLGFEAVGELDSRLETIGDRSGLEGEGTVYYLDDAAAPAWSPALEPLREGRCGARSDPRRRTPRARARGMTAATTLSRERLVSFLAEMLVIRRFEEKVTSGSAPASSPASCMRASARRRSRSASAARSARATWSARPIARTAT